MNLARYFVFMRISPSLQAACSAHGSITVKNQIRQENIAERHKAGKIEAKPYLAPSSCT
jgi:hypothetical protein